MSALVLRSHEKENTTLCIPTVFASLMIAASAVMLGVISLF